MSELPLHFCLLTLAVEELLDVLDYLVSLSYDFVVDQEHVPLPLLDKELVSVILESKLLVNGSEILCLLSPGHGIDLQGLDGVHVDVEGSLGLLQLLEGVFQSKLGGFE